MKGKLIVFEGTDGAGKTTQTRLMAQRLTREGAAFRVIDFPRYGNPFAEPAKLYLNGALGSRPGDVSACGASVLFAVDRYASYREEWGVDYEAGKLILKNEYGFMVGYKNREIVKVPLEEVAGKLKMVDPDSSIIKEAKQLGISFGD